RVDVAGQPPYLFAQPDEFSLALGDAGIGRTLLVQLAIDLGLGLSFLLLDEASLLIEAGIGGRRRRGCRSSERGEDECKQARDNAELQFLDVPPQPSATG